MITLQNSIDFSQPFIDYLPLNAGVGLNPAVTIATITRNLMLNAPLVWGWNRSQDSSLTMVAGTQDYTVNLTDFGFLEKVAVTDPDTNEIFELKDVYNVASLSTTTAVSATRQRPASVSVRQVTYGTSVQFRFMGVPDKAYGVTFIYQKLPIPFGSYTITSVANAAGAALVLTQVAVSGATTTYTGTITGGGSNAFAGMTFIITGFAIGGNNTTITVVASTATTLVCTTTTQANETHSGSAAGGQAVYTGVFNAASFPSGSTATISDFSTAANNGNFSVVSASATRLVVVNPAAVAESAAASVFNGNWSPIPDHFIDVFNTLFLAEAFQMADDARGAQFRQRGVAMLLAKSEGLSDMQKNAFLEQVMALTKQATSGAMRNQQGNNARGV